MKLSKKEINNAWNQDLVIHCPDSKCRGMLLQNPYLHKMKCSECGKFWIEITKFVQVD